MSEVISRFKSGTKVIQGNWHGVVVFNNAIKSYSENYKIDDWEYLGDGIMIEYDEVGLVFSNVIDELEIIDQ